MFTEGPNHTKLCRVSIAISARTKSMSRESVDNQNQLYKEKKPTSTISGSLD